MKSKPYLNGADPFVVFGKWLNGERYVAPAPAPNVYALAAADPPRTVVDQLPKSTESRRIICTSNDRSGFHC